MDSVETILRVHFAIRQLNSTLDLVTSWMTGQEPRQEPFSFEDRAKLAVEFFTDTNSVEKILNHRDYLNLIVAAHKLTGDHASFIAGGCQGDMAIIRDEVRASLNGLAGVLDGFSYPGNTAERLRDLANKT